MPLPAQAVVKPLSAQPIACGQRRKTGAMQTDKPGSLTEMVVQYGDVGKTDEQFRVCTDQPHIQLVEQPQAAETAAQADDRLDIGMSEEAVQFRRPSPVMVGQVAVPGPCLFLFENLKAHLMQDGATLIVSFPLLEVTGRSGDADKITRCRRLGDVHRQQLRRRRWMMPSPFKVRLASTR